MKSFKVYGNKNGGVPLVLLNTYEGDGSAEWAEMEKLGLTDLTFVVVSGMDWDADLTPYASDPVFKGNRFLGQGQAYLSYLVNEVLPAVMKSLQKPPLWYGIAGYSLAGLFAASVLFVDSPFTRIASASGSLWYPGFLEYAQKHQDHLNGQIVSLSLGDKEPLTKNPVMATVGTKTQGFLAFLQSHGIKASFSWNEGNHYAEAERRTAKAIAVLLK